MYAIVIACAEKERVLGPDLLRKHNVEGARVEGDLAVSLVVALG